MSGTTIRRSQAVIYVSCCKNELKKPIHVAHCSEFDDKFGELNFYFNNLLGDSYIKIYDDLCNHSSCFFGTDELFYFADNTHLSKYAVTNFSKAKKQLQSLLSSLE